MNSRLYESLIAPRPTTTNLPVLKDVFPHGHASFHRMPRKLKKRKHPAKIPGGVYDKIGRSPSECEFSIGGQAPSSRSPLIPLKNQISFASQMSSAQRPILDCPYVAKQKAYLRLNGLNVNDVYSLKRHKEEKGENKNKGKSVHSLQSVQFTLPSLRPVEGMEVERETRSRGGAKVLWSPRQSKIWEFPLLHFTLDELDIEASIPGYKPRGILKGRKLGNVLSNKKMKELLNEKEPTIPPAFYFSVNDLQENYFTTSSCSGRIIAFVDDGESVQKKGCKWLFTSHEQAESSEVMRSITGVGGNVVFKFEPFVLHVQCRSLDDAQALLCCGVSSGFRNSGISVGNKGKFITAIRSTHSLEVPICDKGRQLVSDEYIIYIVNLANKKMRENQQRIERFFTNFKHSVEMDKTCEKKFKPKVRQEKKGECIKDESPDVRIHTVETSDNNSDITEDISDCCLFQESIT